MLLALQGLGAAVWARIRSEAPPITGAVTGVVCDGQGRPLGGVQVFVAWRPDLMARTGPDGRFLLEDVPPGEQLIVLAVDDLGQEHRLWVPRAAAPVDMGTVRFVAVRMVEPSNEG